MSRRRALQALAGVGAVLVIVGGVLAWLLGTRSGLEFAWHRVAGRLPGQVRVTSLEGRLFGPLVANGLVLDTDTMHIEIRRAELDWHPLGLLGRNFEVERLALAGVAVTKRAGAAASSAPPASSQPFTLPAQLSLPVGVDIHQVTVERADYYSAVDAAPVTIDRASLGVRLDANQWLLHDIDVRAPLATASGRIGLEPQQPYAADAELDWTLRVGDHPDVVGKTSVSGNLERLVLRQTVQPPYALDARLVVMRPLGAGELDGQLQATLDPKALGLDVPVRTIEASAKVAGSLDSIGVDGRAKLNSEELANAELELHATYANDTVRVGRLQLRQPATNAAVDLEGTVALGPTMRVELGGDWQHLAWPPTGAAVVASPSGKLALSGTPETLKADLTAQVAGGGKVHGTVRRDGGQLDADLDWTDVAWPATNPEARSRKGRLSVTGTLDAYKLDLETDLSMSGNTGHIKASGKGDLKGLTLERIDAGVLGGSLAGHAAATWSPAVSASAQLTASMLDPGLVNKQWRGSVGGRVDASGSLEKQGAAVDIKALKLDGRLRERAVNVDAQGRYAAGTLNLARLDVKSGATELHAQGKLAQQAELSFRVASPDLRDLWPGFAGRLMAHGRVQGPREQPRIVLDADGSGIDVPEVHIGTLALSADVDASGRAHSSLELTVDGAQISGTGVSHLHAAGAGDAADHTFSVMADTDLGTAKLALTGSLERPWQSDFAWNFDVGEATVAYPALAPWSLDRQAKGRLTANAVTLERSCWVSGKAKLCLDAAGDPQGTRADLALTGLPFAYFLPLLAEPVGVEGQLSATAQARLAPKQPPAIDIKLSSTPGRIGAASAASAGAAASDATASQASAGANGKGAAAVPVNVPTLDFGAASGHIVSNAERTTVDLAWPFEQMGKFDLHAVVDRMPGEAVTASAITGNAEAEVNDLTFLADVTDQIDNTGGRLAGRLTLSGTLGAPRLAGRVALEDAHADLIAPAITVQHLNLALTGDGSGEVAVKASAQSGGGTLSGSGNLRLAGSLPVGRLELSGKGFELYDTSDAQVYVSPQLAIEADSQRLSLSGTVTVPKAKFTPREVPQGAVTVSPDQVIVGEETQTAPSGLSRPLYAKVRLDLGDDVTFDGLGLTGKLVGGLQIVEAPKQPTTGSGELSIQKGTYEAYGQKLDIRKGRLVFAGGPITRPGVDVEAVRQATQDILVGARVQGTLAQPQLSLFSEPPLPKQEQLSYLVLGRSLDKASTSETSALSSAAIALGLKGGNFVSQKLNKSLGFQEFGIETEPGATSKSAAFVIGKYLSPSLYLSYGFGLFQPVNTLKLRYTISSHWRLQTESSSVGKGGDLLYHIER